MNVSGEDCSQSEQLNLTTLTAANRLIVTPAEEFFFLVILPCALLCSLIANGCFLYVIAKRRNMRTITNLYLGILAACDIIFVATPTIVLEWEYAVSSVRSNLPFENSLGCVMIYVLSYNTYYISIFMITLMSMEKFYAICHPLKHRVMVSRERTTRLLLTSFILCSLLSLPSILAFSKNKRVCVTWPDTEDFQLFPDIIHLCSPSYPSVVLISEVCFTFTFLISMFGNAFVYVKILGALNERNTSVAIDHNPNAANAHQIRVQVCRMLILNGIVFFLCQFPYRLVSTNTIFIAVLGHDIFTEKQSAIMMFVGRCFLFLNSSINPILYIAASSHYRHQFYRVFCCNRRRKENPYQLSSSQLGDISSKTVAGTTIEISTQRC